MDMYFKCGALEKAQEVFEQLSKPDIVSWNVLIGGYAQHGFSDEALRCFKRMQDVRVHPNVVTYISVLKACGITESLDIGEAVDTEVRKQGLLHKDVMLGNALVDMYAKCGVLEKAQDVFQELPVKNVVTWSALIGGYAHHGHGDEALRFFKLMQGAGVRPNSVTYINALKACGIVGSLEIGESIYAEVRNEGLLGKEVELGNALVDMYSKCGALEEARKVFKQLPAKNVVSWTALIEGYAQLGEADVVLHLYERMRARSVVPNSVTFTVLLTACSHAGLVEEGQNLFSELCTSYGLMPTLEHYSCMIDLFGRAGNIDKVKSLLSKVSYSDDDLPLFLTLLGACKKWRNVKLGKWAFEQSMQLDETCAAAYVCMESIYTDSAGMQFEAHEIKHLNSKNRDWNIE
jgi:pentatricopeptide repeat protein